MHICPENANYDLHLRKRESIECRSSTAQSAPISRKLRRSTAQRLKQETAYVSVYEISDEASQAKPIPLALFQIFYYIQCNKKLFLTRRKPCAKHRLSLKNGTQAGPK